MSSPILLVMSAGAQWLFVDVNSFFASCEQADRAELRGVPVAVVPVEAETTCCIAVSYQAKPYGVRTGVSVAEARTLCPQLVLVPSRPQLYVEYHHRIKAAIERCVPVEEVLSVDEFSCRLMGQEGQPERATAIAYAIKREMRTVGESLRCSIGIGPNRLLAKIAGEMQKPDGLMVLERRHLPEALYCLPLGSIPGVGRRMERRLEAAGIRTMRQLCASTQPQMSKAWGSVLGDRMWLLLKGEDFPDAKPKARQTLSKQHILPPDCRTMERARAISLKMLHTTAMRLRRGGQWATGVWLQVGFQGRNQAFQGHLPFAPCQDTYSLQAHMMELWSACSASASFEMPSDLTVALTGLTASAPADLFAGDLQGKAAAAVGAVDMLNARYGQNAVYLGSIAGVKKEAPMRISFGPPPELEDFREIA